MTNIYPAQCCDQSRERIEIWHETSGGELISVEWRLTGFTSRADGSHFWHVIIHFCPFCGVKLG